MNTIDRTTSVRLALLWLASSAGFVVVCTVAAGPVRALASAPGPDFVGLWVQVCAAAAVLAAAALWLLCADLVLRWRRAADPGTAPLLAVQRRLLRLVGVVTIGAVVVGSVGVGSPTAHASSIGSSSPGRDGDTPPPLAAPALAGLPSPDRAVDVPDRTPLPPAAAVAASRVVVRPGDSLWSLAARQAGRGASTSEVAAVWLRLCRLNAAALDDPDLIRPGLVLRLPGPPAPPHSQEDR